MCGRFVQNFSFETLQQNFNIHTSDSDIIPNYNVAPTQEILTIIKHNNEYTLDKFHWGLVPFWAKDISIGSRMINARAETVSSKPSLSDRFIFCGFNLSYSKGFDLSWEKR